MSLRIYLPSMSQSNSSDISRLFFEEFNFGICEGIEGGRTVWAVCTGLCFVLGFPATVAILWEMIKTHRRGTSLTPNDFFMLNLSVMDVVFLIFITPGLLNHYIFRSTAFDAFWNGVYSLNTCGRPLLMACSCLDCYVAVVHPITYHKRKSLTPRVVIAAVVWALTIAYGIAFFFSFMVYYSFFTTLPFIISIVTIGICDCLILRTLVKSDPGRGNIHPQKQRAIQTLVDSLVMTVLSYLPPFLFIVIGKPLVSSFKTFICYIGIPMTITSSSGSAIMPLLHLYHRGKLDGLRPGCLGNL